MLQRLSEKVAAPREQHELIDSRHGVFPTAVIHYARPCCCFFRFLGVVRVCGGGGRGGAEEAAVRS